ncbi:MAG: hypothetical protein KIB43_04460 [Clostridium baratii]|uniref:Uncharacterized protein n=1 Tax=Clostridium baratii str. Sullivan TaxID=1415775 RepID=A0A0A7FTP8_9CLOT|nr:hypothetical protein [Clostridium baratii]AIY82987.1 hypothetical protein U729_2438 [Clostridium baratii str. Sullivan]MBS6006190.1 hypothetical protein [Clostridium baratii]MDU1053264.1 hypothetical protein [Clostridium baratii]MDU4911210.1 hypothetical protein [Clostridium baratii]CUP10250.1 Uncharacterised protein [Clostridium baratii]
MGNKNGWIKYLGFGIVFGVIFEMLGLGISSGVVGAMCVLFIDSICIDKRAKDNAKEYENLL